jgi:hypothetical protein
VVASEQSRVDSTYGSGKRAGKFQYIADACRDVGEQFLSSLETHVATALQADANTSDGALATAEGPLLEHPANTAARDALAKWTALGASTRAELDAWTQIVAELEKQAKEATAGAKAKLLDADDAGAQLGAKDAAFLASHTGGALARSIASVVAGLRVRSDVHSVHALRRLQAEADAAALDQAAISRRVHAEERRAFGESVAVAGAGETKTTGAGGASAASDPRGLIAALTADSEANADMQQE